MVITNRAAFSLVELSIVLVILGLLTGGILAGQSLIRASELRSLTAESQRFITATHAFRDKYFYTPGDIPNATSFWGVGTCPGTAAQPATSVATCNGDGDGSLDWSNAAVTNGGNEKFRYWQHLANAGMIEGQYSGVVTADAYTWSVGTANGPNSRINSAVWSAISRDNAAGVFTGSFWYKNYVNAINVGIPNASSWNHTPILRSEEAWNIDTKLDDGLPSTGKVHGSATTACSGAANGGVTGATYALSSTGLSCFMIFLPQG